VKHDLTWINLLPSARVSLPENLQGEGYVEKRRRQTKRLFNVHHFCGPSSFITTQNAKKS
jgi:hypothetical protein